MTEQFEDNLKPRSTVQSAMPGNQDTTPGTLNKAAEVKDPIHPDDKGRIYVCQPWYGKGSRDSARQFDCGMTKGRLTNRITAVSGGNSLLANSFNNLWCNALNLQEAGEDIRFFGMLHDDVVPETGWLDMLLEDLLTSGADLVSALVPIKDSLGVTSTAIDDPNDHFTVQRRLTMREAFSLPEIFTAADAGYPDRHLLINTGCWLCRFDKAWRFAENPDGTLKVHFTIDDAIARSRKADANGHHRWEARVASEDWNLSRFIQEEGGKVVCTRRLKLTHEGGISYSNHRPWGEWEYDHNLQEKFGSRRINFDKDVDFEMPHEIRGWLTETEGKALADLAKGKVVLEIGSFCGRSTVCLARPALKVFCVDPFNSRNTLTAQEDTFEEFSQNLINHSVAGKVATSRGLSTDPDMVLPEMVDLVFIDGDHSYEAVKADIEVAYKWLKPDGIIAFHDYQSVDDPGVAKAVDELLDKPGVELVATHRTLAVVKGRPIKLDLSQPTVNGHAQKLEVACGS